MRKLLTATIAGLSALVLTLATTYAAEIKLSSSPAAKDVLPAEIQHYTAKAFVNFMRSENAVLVIRSKGLEPG